MRFFSRGQEISQQAAAVLVQANRPIAFAPGCFDLLHLGHARLLSGAAEHGFVVAGVNSDDSVRRLKGNGRPVIPERERALLVSFLQPVGLVVLFDEVAPIGVMQWLSPESLVKGQSSGSPPEAAGFHGQVVWLPVCDEISTTSILRRGKCQTG